MEVPPKRYIKNTLMIIDVNCWTVFWDFTFFSWVLPYQPLQHRIWKIAGSSSVQDHRPAGMSINFPQYTWTTFRVTMFQFPGEKTTDSRPQNGFGGLCSEFSIRSGIFWSLSLSLSLWYSDKNRKIQWLAGSQLRSYGYYHVPFFSWGAQELQSEFCKHMITLPTLGLGGSYRYLTNSKCLVAGVLIHLPSEINSWTLKITIF